MRWRCDTALSQTGRMEGGVRESAGGRVEEKNQDDSTGVKMMHRCMRNAQSNCLTGKLMGWWRDEASSRSGSDVGADQPGVVCDRQTNGAE